MDTMTKTEPTTIPALIGESVRSIREAHRIPREEIAAEMRRHGFKWSANRVTDLEAGKKAVGIKELVGLAHALSRLSSDDVRIGDLLRTETHREAEKAGVNEPNNALLKLTDITTVPVQTFAGYFRDQPVDLDLGDEAGGGAGPRFYDLFNKDPAHFNRLLGGNKDMNTFGTLDEPGELERALGHKLKVKPEEVLAASIGLWRQTLTQKREARVRELEEEDRKRKKQPDQEEEEPNQEERKRKQEQERKRQTRSLQARRGRVTLALQKEVQERLDAEARGELPDPPSSSEES